MAHYCFVSLQQLGHLDFGGQGFLRLAQTLKERGHQVTWIFSVSDNKGFAERAIQTCNLLDEVGIGHHPEASFYLTEGLHHQDVIASAQALARFIQDKGYHCLVIDRVCVGAAFAATWAGIPWATMGTDGREWSYDNPTLMPKPSVKALFNVEAYSPEIAKTAYIHSYWATSPFLNLSFFPRAYYADPQYSEIPPHSHFLGAGQDGELAGEGESVLITFGNTFNDNVKIKLVKCISAETEKRNLPILILTGSERLTSQIGKELRNPEAVTLKAWMSYDEAYRAAKIAVGHGGTAHVWTGMRDAVPLLVIPDIGDQVFGGEQVERLNIGRAIQLERKAPAKFDLLRRFLRKPLEGDFNAAKCIRALNELLDDPGIQASSLHIQRQMKSGGGVSAGASLLESLANDGKPVIQCANDACCC